MSYGLRLLVTVLCAELLFATGLVENYYIRCFVHEKNYERRVSYIRKLRTVGTVRTIETLFTQLNQEYDQLDGDKHNQLFETAKNTIHTIAARIPTQKLIQTLNDEDPDKALFMAGLLVKKADPITVGPLIRLEDRYKSCDDAIRAKHLNTMIDKLLYKILGIRDLKKVIRHGNHDVKCRVQNVLEVRCDGLKPTILF